MRSVAGKECVPPSECYKHDVIDTDINYWLLLNYQKCCDYIELYHHAMYKIIIGMNNTTLMQHINIELVLFIICIFHKVQLRIQNPKLH